MKFSISFAAPFTALLLPLLLAGCGQKGPLYLPQQTAPGQPVVTATKPASEQKAKQTSQQPRQPQNTEEEVVQQ